MKKDSLFVDFVFEFSGHFSIIVGNRKSFVKSNIELVFSENKEKLSNG